MKVLIFGGTGSLGYILNKRFLDKEYQVLNYSRDEQKHWKMRLDFNNNPKQDFMAGDANDPTLVRKVIKRFNPNYIIIAHAMKHIDIAEGNMDSCLNNNLLSIKNILDTVEENLSRLVVQKVLFVSSDKACSPVNSYGMCKALGEQMMSERAYRLRGSPCHFVAVRYGNVLNSNGSIIPILHKLGSDKEVQHFRLTHPCMTRFAMTLQEAAELIEYALSHAMSGEIVIPRLRAMRIADLITIFSKHYNKPVEETGIRPGEKMHEELINATQCMRAVEKNGYIHIRSPLLFREILNKVDPYTSVMTIDYDALEEFLREKKLL